MSYPQTLVLDAISLAVTNGVVISSSKLAKPGIQLLHAPFTLYPSHVDNKSYQQAIHITPMLNRLTRNISQDEHYLRVTLKGIGNADQFSKRLLQIMKHPPVEKVGFSINRYDYFIDQAQNHKQLKMVEMNCIASSFAALGTRIGKVHKLLTQYQHNHEKVLPQNDALNGLVEGFGKAVEMYKQCGGGPNAIIVMVVQKGERNSYDQDILRHSILEKLNVQVVRLTLAEIHQFTYVDDKQLLWYKNNDQQVKEIALLYYRAGYTPDDYYTENEWIAREKVENSRAIKCPSIAMQLVGTKKIQQVLDKENQVEKFVSEQDAAEIRKTFVRQYSLDRDDHTQKIVDMAIQQSDNFVLKPQREGGGNNLYGEDIKAKLLQMNEQEREAYVLMERIRPVIVDNVIVREGQAVRTDIVSEFGVYGISVWKYGQEDMENLVAGTLLRSKAASQDDGGVAAGVAVLDSPCLVD